jgi:hypothetical protein
MRYLHLTGKLIGQEEIWQGNLQKQKGKLEFCKRKYIVMPLGFLNHVTL